MSDRSDLENDLSGLSIDRDQPVGYGRPILIFVAIAIIGGVSLIAWWLLSRDTVLQVATALASPPSVAAPDESVLDATGYVIARRSATVSSRIAGRVATVLVEEGMAVEEGQLLATLDDSITRSQLDVSQASVDAQKVALKQYRSQLKKAMLDLQRLQELQKDNYVSQNSIDDAAHQVEQLGISIDRAREDINLAEKSVQLQLAYLQDYEIRAPFTGIVIAKSAQPGEMIAPVAGGGFTRTGICTIVDMESLEVEIDVNEQYINRVRPKQQVTVQLTAYPDTQMPAEVIAIIPTADRSRATVKVRVKLNDRDSRVLPDMGVKVAFLEEGEKAELRQIPQGVVIPTSAIDQSSGSAVIWVVKDNVVRSRTVRVAETLATTVRIEDGLRVGERVVTNLNENLRAQVTDGMEVEVL